MYVVAIGDLHCGHKVGLTPPAWWVSEERYPNVYKWQRESWEAYTKMIDEQVKRGRVDVLIANGDLIDGRGERSGSSELIVTDRCEQTDMAIECLRKWNAATVLLTYGTAYHTGKIEDWEDRVAEQLGADIAGRHQVDVGGVTFDARHHVGSSSIPHGRQTAVSRERLWNSILSGEDQESRADVILRSHVHYHSFAGGS